MGAPKGSSKLAKGMIILAWEIPLTEEPGRRTVHGVTELHMTE